MKIKMKVTTAVVLMLVCIFGCTKQDNPNNGENTQNIPVGALSGVFKVSETKQVRFAKGNLQYNAKSNVWRFAETQWSIVGEPGFLGNVFDNGIQCSNDSVSPTYGGWIDLFGWGTSGWNSGANCFEPWSTSNQADDYIIGGNPSLGLVDTYYKADWGSNPISNGGNSPDLWRVLTHEEWLYLYRNNIMFRASIDGVNGLFILPKGFQIPDGMFQYTLDNENWHHNRYNLSGGQRMEANGAVFLPITGCRMSTNTLGTTNGYYWSSSPEINSACAYAFEFTGEHIRPSGFFPYRAQGYAVRLVQDL